MNLASNLEGFAPLFKICSCCKLSLPLDNFHKSSKAKDGLKGQCKTCRNIYNSKWNNENKERKSKTNKWNHKKRMYGISEEDYCDLLVKQNQCCAICSLYFSENLHGHLYVDHCHTTGKVRGLLCQHCNSLLGKAKDDIDILQSAIKYLQRNL